MTVTASYGGNTNNLPSSGAFTLSVTVRTSKTTVSCSPTSAVFGSTKVITCKAKVSGYSPTGSVTWSQSGGTGSVNFVFATCSLSKGACSVTMTGASGGTVTVLAVYSGDPNNAGGTSNAAKLTIKPAKTSLSVTCTSSSVVVGSSASCTATLTGYASLVAGETVTWSQSAGSGKVSFSSSSSTTCTLSAGGTCLVALTGAREGSVTLKAVYGGDPDNQGSSRTAKLAIKNAT